MSTTIDSLDIQISTSAGQSAANIEKLADALEKLRANAKLGPTIKNLEKLKNTLNGLSTGGFAKLTPKVNIAISATNKMAEASKNAKKGFDMSSMGLFSLIQNYESLIGVVNRAIKAVSQMLSQAIEWDGIQFRFGRAFGEDAEETYEWIQKINDALGINIQEFMQYSSLYGSLLSGFGMEQEKITAISVGLTELSYDIWAAYNDRFKSLEAASEAVRSAITGEIEPIRNAGIALTEASLQEFIDGTHLAGVSIEKLTEAQKSEVRYAAMVDAAMNQGIVGTYAREMQTAEGAVRSLSQSFKGLVQALGSLFIPLLQVVVPYVTAFVELLTEAVFMLAELFGIPIQEIDWGNTGIGDIVDDSVDATEGLEAASEAAKKLKQYTMGFDELNVINPNSGVGGGTGGGTGEDDWGGGLDLDSLWDDSILAQASKRVDELKEKITDFFEKWKTEIAIIGAALGVLSVSKLLTGLGEALGFGDKFLEVMKTITKLASSAIIITLQFAIQSELFSKFIEEGSWKDYLLAAVVGAIGTGILYSMWGPAGIVVGLAVTAVASLSAVIDNGGITNVESATVAFTGLASAVGAVALAWKLISTTDLGAFIELLREGEPLLGSLAAWFPSLANSVSAMSTSLSSAASAVGTFLAGLSATALAVIAAVIAAIATVVYFLYENWEKVTNAVKKFFDENIAPKLEEISTHFTTVKNALSDLVGAFTDAFERAKDFITGIDWSKLSWIGTIFETIGGIIFSVVGGVIAVAFNVLLGAIENVIQMFSGFAKIVSGAIEFVVALFTGGDIERAWKNIWSGVWYTLDGYVSLFLDIIIDLVSAVVDWFNNLSKELLGKSVPEIVRGVISWFSDLFKKVTTTIKDLVKDILKKFKDLWSDLKSWWNSDVAPKLTVDYWKTKFDGIRSGLKAKLDEAWDAIQEFFSIEKWKKAVEDAVKAIKDNFKMPTLPKIKLDVTWDTNVGPLKKAVYEALGLSGWPNLSWTAYAMGGFPGEGEAFIAREAGPELVGRIGNRSAVMNNDQIVAAVSQGVYSAVVTAMGENRSNSGSQPIMVYLDGKQIYSSVKRTESRRGVDLMGNQLGYVY